VTIIRSLTPENQKVWLEKKVEGEGCKLAKTLGGIAYKFTSPQRRAVPDRLVLLPFRAGFFIEYKRWGKKPTPAQLREGHKLIRMGQYVYYVDNVNDAEYIIRRWAICDRPDMIEYSLPDSKIKAMVTSALQGEECDA